MIKVVEAWQQPTHRFYRDGRYIYLVAHGVIDVAHACVLDVSDVEVNNAGKWSKVDQVNPCAHEGMK